MHAMPGDWLEQIKARYPRRSGGFGWLDMRLMLSVRRALLTHSWDQITQAIDAYREYCEASGKAGSELVQKPKTWFDQGGYDEAWDYALPQDPKIRERERQNAQADGAAETAGRRVGLIRHPLESRAAFETRIRLAETSPRMRNA